ncbi:MAG: retroviral-like aspartic protease family protein [Candidatus Omnitrophica bacterium]|nr:retroviral-like aspartic protease family protein [Candidatus Omnitrophota bacterium]
MGKFKFDITEGVILCKAKITNKRQSLFLKLAVDTGASFTMISIENALAIGIDPSKSMRHIEITTANGIVFAPIIRIPSFKCFGIELKNIEVICHNLPPESPVEGLLGLNFLKGAKAILDFSQNIIEVVK